MSTSTAQQNEGRAAAIVRGARRKRLLQQPQARQPTCTT